MISQQAGFADAVCGDLSGEVAFTLVGRANIGEDEGHQFAGRGILRFMSFIGGMMRPS